MPVIKFLKEKKEIDVPAGANLRTEAIKAGVAVNKGINGFGDGVCAVVNCCGLGLCGTCRVNIKKGMDNTNGLTASEWVKFKALPVPDPMPFFAYVDNEATMRLACCTTVNGDIEVETAPEMNLFGENFFS